MKWQDLATDEVSLKIVCDSDTFTCGSTITGKVHVSVHCQFSFTSLKLRFRGREERVERRSRTRTTGKAKTTSYYDDIERRTYVEQFYTLFGGIGGSTGSGKVTWLPGKKEYPFSIAVPLNLPPAFAVFHRTYGCAVTYTLTAIVDIPMAVDKKLEVQLPLREAVSVQQLLKTREQIYTLKPYDVPAAEPSFSSCCGPSGKEFLTVNVALAPRIVVMEANAKLPETKAVARRQNTAPDAPPPKWPAPIPVGDDPSRSGIRVRVTNHMKKATVTNVSVELALHYTVKRGSLLSDETDKGYTLFSKLSTFPKGPLKPGESDDVNFFFHIRNELLLDSKMPPIPTIRTDNFRSYTVLKVDFPDMNTSYPLRVNNAFLLVDAIDFERQGPLVPRTYHSNVKTTKIERRLRPWIDWDDLL